MKINKFLAFSIFSCVFIVFAYTLPPGLTNKPIEQMTQYLNKKLPAGFEQVNANFYQKNDGWNNGILHRKGVSLENGIVFSVEFEWQSSDYNKVAAIREEIFRLMNQYKLDARHKNQESVWIYGNRVIALVIDNSRDGYRCILWLLAGS